MKARHCGTGRNPEKPPPKQPQAFNKAVQLAKAAALRGKPLPEEE